MLNNQIIESDDSLLSIDEESVKASESVQNQEDFSESSKSQTLSFSIEICDLKTVIEKAKYSNTEYLTIPLSNNDSIELIRLKNSKDKFIIMDSTICRIPTIKLASSYDFFVISKNLKNQPRKGFVIYNQFVNDANIGCLTLVSTIKQNMPIISTFYCLDDVKEHETNNNKKLSFLGVHKENKRVIFLKSYLLAKLQSLDLVKVVVNKPTGDLTDERKIEFLSRFYSLSSAIKSCTTIEELHDVLSSKLNYSIDYAYVKNILTIFMS